MFYPYLSYYLFSQQTANFMHSIEYQYMLLFFSNKFLKNRENCEYQLRNESDYIIPRINLDYLSIYPGSKVSKLVLAIQRPSNSLSLFILVFST